MTSNWSTYSEKSMALAIPGVQSPINEEKEGCFIMSACAVCAYFLQNSIWSG